jgi:hypothetical protein
LRERRRPAGVTPTTTEAIAQRIHAPTGQVAWLLADEAKRRRVRQTPNGAWTIVAGAFPDGTVEALAQLG